MSVVDQAIRAVQYDHLDILRDLILSNRVSSNACDNDDCSLLHWAAINNRIDIVKFLVSQNCNVNHQGGILKETSLHWAIRKKNYIVAHFLLNNGADSSLKSGQGLSPLFLSCELDLVNMAYLLLCQGADPNCFDDEGNPLLIWILKTMPTNVWDILRLLLKFGADPKLQDKNGNTAMHVACLQPQEHSLYSLNILFPHDGNQAARTLNADGRSAYKLIAQVRNGEAVRFFFDALLSRYLPFWLPNALVAASALSGLLLIRRFGLLYGLLLWLVVYTVLEKGSLPMLLQYVCRPMNGALWGSILGMWMMFALELKTLVSPIYSTAIDLCGLVTSVTLLWCMWKKPLYLRKPTDRNSILPVMLQRYSSSLEGLGGDGSWEDSFRLCTTCLTDKGLASTHCSRCDACVVDVEHHCPYVQNCIGRGNRRIFIAFTLSACASSGLFSVLSLWAQYHHFCPNQKGVMWGSIATQACMLDKSPALALITWIAVLASIWGFTLGQSQLAFVAMETTTFELMRHRHDGKMRGGCVRSCRNVGQFVCTGNYVVTAQPTLVRDNQSQSQGAALDGDLEDAGVVTREDAPLLPGSPALPDGDGRRGRPGDFSAQNPHRGCRTCEQAGQGGSLAVTPAVWSIKSSERV